MNEHPIKQPIRGIDLPNDGSRIRNYAVGVNGVTLIEAVEKSGQYSHIPYVRVWKGDVCEGEFCQHNIVGVYFDVGEPEPVADTAPRADDFDPSCPKAASHEPGVYCADCWIPF